MIESDRARILVFIGELCGHVSPVTTFSRLVGAEITLGAGKTIDLDVDPAFEHGVLVDSGEVEIGAAAAAQGGLIHVDAGADVLRLSARRSPARLLLLGGEPLNERIVMWWNFIGRSHEEIVGYRRQWQDERVAEAASGVELGRFGRFPQRWTETLPAPDLPRVRLKSRG